jgi:hypothetical protein
MSELNSKARALLDATQFADEPSAADSERIHAAIAARIAVGVSAGAVALLITEATAASTVAAPAANGIVSSAVAAGTAAAPAAQAIVASSAVVAAPAVVGSGAAALGITSSAALAAKVGAWAVAVGLTGAAMGLTARQVVASRSPVPAVHQASPTASAKSGAPAALTRSATRADSDLSLSTTPSDPQPTPSVGTAPPVRVPGAGPGAPLTPGTAGAHTEEPSPSGYAPTLDAELALIRRAHTLLIEGHADEALVALDEHALRFPAGVLAEDRAAQRVLALCALGRFEAAHEEGQQFVSNHPLSPHVAAIRSSCAFVASREN